MTRLEYIIHIDIKLISECKLLWLLSKNLKADTGREITVAQHQALNQISCNKNIENRNRQLLQAMSKIYGRMDLFIAACPILAKE
jgi:hypothetical protein